MGAAATLVAATTTLAAATITLAAATTLGARASASATTLRPSRTSMVTPTEPAGGRITPGRLGATPPDGTTRAVETFRAPQGSLTTPGPTGPAATRAEFKETCNKYELCKKK